ncbi:putative calcium/potassium channel (CAKC) [Trypanosoma grayi]|uniref:putative calcium/potassium channel (CAKC) n=1 Tax=Trypanosoma grayi TaxID=71804 RepID=UPI0004F43776|nr:putative calcium/potassium channel (CAKC) [Trypanosoma grayi]KEG14532.1 putative calcium/potassium channel (CAKC) [Trypanosoma grayi]
MKHTPYAVSVAEVERLLHHLLGLGVAVPGAVPLIMNLLRTYEPRPSDVTLSHHWIEQYEWSLHNDIYCVEMRNTFRGREFHWLARLFFNHDVTLIGIINDEGVVELNPHCVTSSATKMIVIAKCLQAARRAINEVERVCCAPFTEEDVKSDHAGMMFDDERHAHITLRGVTGGGIEALQKVDDAYDLENHFVIIDLAIAKARAPETEGAQVGSLTSAAADVFHVLRSIRQTYSQNDIVLLTQDTSFSAYFERYWNSLRGAIPVRHVEGCGLNENDLRRCNVKNSAGILIFISGDISGASTSGLSMLVDLSLAAILPSFHNIPVVVELDSLQHLSLFPPYAEDDLLHQKAEVDFVFEPNYIIGNALSRHMLFPLVHRTYFMEEFIDIIDMLVSGMDDDTPSLGRLPLALTPEALETYEDVANYCLSLCYLPIGLHRRITDPRNLSLSGQRFVLTNPPRNLPVDREGDAVFYLLPT